MPNVTTDLLDIACETGAPGDESRVLRARLAEIETLTVPTLVIEGATDTVALPPKADTRGRYFNNGNRRVLLDGIGHFTARGAPDAVARELVQHFNRHGKTT